MHPFMMMQAKVREPAGVRLAGGESRPAHNVALSLWRYSLGRVSKCRGKSDFGCLGSHSIL